MAGGKGLYKPTTQRMRGPLDNGSVGDKISHPPRYAELGGLTSPAKVRKGKNTMSVKPPGGRG